MAGLGKTIKSYSKTFWIANIIELLERWGWYGMYMVLALYLTGSRDTGALGFSQTEKGLIMGIGTAILYFLPPITGAIADKVGYKKMLIVSFLIYAIGFILLGQFVDFYVIFIIYLFIAVGSALFKPVPAATVTKTTTAATSSIGFGIYYMMVNIGGVIGPVFAAKLRPHALTDESGNFILNELGKPMMDAGNWNYVFYLSAGILLLSLLLVMFFYREPERIKNEDPLGKSIKVIVGNIFTSLKDIRLVIFIILIIGFWTVYYQLFFALPVFIDQWVDTAQLYNFIASISPWLAGVVGTESGTISAELLSTLPAFYIVIFQILVSALVMKWRPINAMITGIFVNAIGLGLTFMSQNPFYLMVSVLIFAFGEMASSPKIIEYLGRIAPKEKRALYIGCSFLPVAGGSFFGGMLSGVYETMSDKITLLQREVLSRGLDIQQISESFTQNDYIRRASELMGMNPQELTNFLWDKYQPFNFWMVIVGIGLATVVLLILYDKLLLKSGPNQKANNTTGQEVD